MLDGGLATELERRGADIRDPLWSAKVLVEDPKVILGVHTSYFEAGADVAISASYQASFEGFAARGIARRDAEDLLRQSVRIAVEARAST
ncbi:MAG TPA: homocysteine S-methyltransferase family protein, partial [Actinomycetota bacterium]|nr:homocysteine S-methyltransferase family protein [Actinomycetota bacterium]